MACVTSPTATQTNFHTSQSLSTSFSESVTTLPPTTSTTTITSCILTGSGSTTGCLQTTEIVSTTTIPGSTQTTSVPVVSTIDITDTETITLWGTSCPAQQDPNTSSSPSTVITSASTSTLPDGAVTTVFQTTTSTIPYTPSSSDGSVQQTGQGDDSGTNLGPIIGGAVGGVVGLIGIVLIVWFVLKRRRNWDDIFDKEDDHVIANTGRAERFSLTADVEPKPYEYGLVGHTSPHSTSPPNSPPLHPHDTSTPYDPYAVGAGGDLHHRRNASSLSPLNLSPNGMGVVSSGLTPTTAMTHSRPSTSGSMQPLYPPQQQPQPQQPQNQYQNQYLNTRPPSSHMSHSQSSSLSSPPLQPQFMGWASPNTVGTAEDAGYFNRAGSPQSFSESQQRRLQVANQDVRMSSAPNTPANNIVEEDPYGGYAAYAASTAASSQSQPRSQTLTTLTGPTSPTATTVTSSQSAAEEKARLRTVNASDQAGPAQTQHHSSQEGSSSGNGADDAPPPAYSA